MLTKSVRTKRLESRIARLEQHLGQMLRWATDPIVAEAMEGSVDYFRDVHLALAVMPREFRETLAAEQWRVMAATDEA